MAQMACPACGAVFDNRDDLRAHRENCQGNFTPPEGEFNYKCGKCGQRFNTVEALGTHALRCRANLEP